MDMHRGTLLESFPASTSSLKCLSERGIGTNLECTSKYKLLESGKRCCDFPFYRLSTCIAAPAEL